MHDVLELPHCHAKNQNGPAELIELKPNVPDLHCSYRQHKCERIQAECQGWKVLGKWPEAMQMGIVLDRVGYEIGICIENSSNEPQPLRCPKEGNGVLNFVKVRTVSHLDKFSKEQDFAE